MRGPLVMKGYWNKPEQTAEAFAGGWLHTGDVAREDERRASYTIVDRKKDMIVSGGFNVFPREVEDVISTHPAVAAVARDRRARREVGRGGQGGRRAARPAPTVDADELIALVKERKGSHPRAEVGRLRRRDPAQPARQARQEGAARPLLGGRGPPGELTLQRRRRSCGTPACTVSTTRSTTAPPAPATARRRAGTGRRARRRRTRRGSPPGAVGRRQEQRQRPLGRHRLAQAQGRAPGGAALDGRGDGAPRDRGRRTARRCRHPPRCRPRSGCGRGTGAAGRRRRPRRGSDRPARPRSSAASPPPARAAATRRPQLGRHHRAVLDAVAGEAPAASSAASASASAGRVTQCTATGRSGSWAARIQPHQVLEARQGVVGDDELHRPPRQRRRGSRRRPGSGPPVTTDRCGQRRPPRPPRPAAPGRRAGRPASRRSRR